MAESEDAAESPLSSSLSGLSARAGFAQVEKLLGAHKIVRVHNTAGAF